MPPRPIVRDPDVYDGRWHIDGTLIFVPDVQADYRSRGEAMRASYRRMGLSDPEIDAALAFTFPPVVDAPSIEVKFVSVIVRCVCGQRRQAMAGPDMETDVCPCGRTWRLPIAIEPGRHEPPPRLLTGVVE